MNGINISTASEIRFGNTLVSEIYFGSNKLWPLSHDYSQDYLTFEALESGTFTFTGAIYYSLNNGSTWTLLTANTATPTVNAGNKILWKYTGYIPMSSTGCGTFSATGNFNVMGNIMSLYYNDNFVGQNDLTGKSYAFVKLFYNNTKLIDASNFILPATTLTNNCYNSMFNGCTALTSAPELPATTLTNNCYNSMFANCTALTSAPELPATTLTNNCYNCMFANCKALTTAPSLPATTLATGCYASMFQGCSSLTTAPSLPATTLEERCYYWMFYGCTSLTTAPELPATTLTNQCYRNMFRTCTSLNYIKCLATDISATNCTSSWVNGVSPTGTFVKDASMTGWTTGINGIPSGWTVQNA